MKEGGVGAGDEGPERDGVICCQAYNPPMIVFWDVDAPATLARLEENPRDPFRELIPQYDAIFTYGGGPRNGSRSEEHTSELQSHLNLVCRLLLEKKNKNKLRLNSSIQQSIQ